MNFERSPIRLLFPLERQTEHLAWPDWWKIEPDTRIIQHEQMLLALPPTGQISSDSASTIISYEKIVHGGVEQEPFSAETFHMFPCLYLVPVTQLIKCYAHPLDGGTFFYRSYRGYLLFSTSLHDMCRVTQSWAPNDQTVADFLFSSAFMQTDGSASFIAGIRKIPPGSCLTIDQRKITTTSYWHPQHHPQLHAVPMKTTVHAVRETLQQAIRRAIGDATVVSVFYSGGVDSSAVAGLAQQEMRKRGGHLVLISAGDEVATREEALLRKTFASALHCPLIEVPFDLSQDILPILRQSNRYSSSPANGLFASVNEVIAQEALAQGAEIMLTGEGGEEVFSSNDVLLADLLVQKKWRAAYQCLCYQTAQSQNARESLVQGGLKPLTRILSKPWQRTLLTYLSNILDPSSVAEEDHLHRLYGREYASRRRLYQHRAIQNLQEAYHEGWTLNDYQALLGVRALPPFDHHVDYLNEVSLHTASPLTDPAVFQASLLLNEDAARLGVGFRNKALLRYVASPVVPANVLAHPKINVADLPWRILRHQLDTILAVFSSPCLSALGIVPQLTKEDFLEPNFGPLTMIHVLVLAIWLEELKKDVESHTR